MALDTGHNNVVHYQQKNQLLSTFLLHFSTLQLLILPVTFQRTERAPKDRNVAETDPSKFANMLIEKLERVIEEREKIERIKESLHSLEVKRL